MFFFYHLNAIRKVSASYNADHATKKLKQLLKAKQKTVSTQLYTTGFITQRVPRGESRILQMRCNACII